MITVYTFVALGFVLAITGAVISDLDHIFESLPGVLYSLSMLSFIIAAISGNTMT